MIPIDPWRFRIQSHKTQVTSASTGNTDLVHCHTPTTSDRFCHLLAIVNRTYGISTKKFLLLNVSFGIFQQNSNVKTTNPQNFKSNWAFSDKRRTKRHQLNSIKSNVYVGNRWKAVSEFEDISYSIYVYISWWQKITYYSSQISIVYYQRSTRSNILWRIGKIWWHYHELHRAEEAFVEFLQLFYLSEVKLTNAGAMLFGQNTMLPNVWKFVLNFERFWRVLEHILQMGHLSYKLKYEWSIHGMGSSQKEIEFRVERICWHASRKFVLLRWQCKSFAIWRPNINRYCWVKSVHNYKILAPNFNLLQMAAHFYQKTSHSSSLQSKPQQISIWIIFFFK